MQLVPDAAMLFCAREEIRDDMQEKKVVPTTQFALLVYDSDLEKRENADVLINGS